MLMLAGVLIVTAATPAAAHDCSSAEDCGNVVQGSGLLATFLAILLGVSAAKVKGKGKGKEKGKDKDPEWVHAHFQAVAGVAPDMVVEVLPRMEGSPPTFVVRIDPHTDSGTQVVEEIAQ